VVRRGFAVPLLSGLMLAVALPLAPGRSSDRGLEGQLDALRAAGVHVERRLSCGDPRFLALYNMGLNVLCLSQGLEANAAQQAKVLAHESVHVVQDCLDGLDTPTSSTLAQGLRSTGQFSAEQLNGFFLGYLRRQGNLAHVLAATAQLQPDSRQREIEAYALQADPALVERLIGSSCRVEASPALKAP
jgi:hypothetical protein